MTLDSRSIVDQLVRRGAQFGVVGCMLVAVLSAVSASPPTALVGLAAGIGTNLLSSILHRAACGESITPEDLEPLLHSAEDISAIRTIVEDRLSAYPAVQAMVDTERKMLQALAGLNDDVNNLRQESYQRETFIAQQTVEMRAEYSQGQQQLLSNQTGQGEMLQRILALAEAKAADTPVADTEIEFRSQVDMARKQQEAGRFDVAREMLLETEQAVAHLSVSEHLRYRIAANLGACAYNLDDMPTAAKDFRRAHEFEPQNIDAITLAALGAALDGNPRVALALSGEARCIDPRAGNASAVYVRALYDTEGIAVVDTFAAAEPWLDQDVSCCMTMSDISRCVARYDEAERYARLALTRDSRLPDAHMMLGQALISGVLGRSTEGTAFPWALTNLETSRLEEAEAEFSSVIGHTSNGGNQGMRHMALANRAGIRGRLDRPVEALSDCDAVLDSDPGHNLALYNKGIGLLQQGHADEGVRCLERLSDATQKRMALIPLSSAYLCCQQPGKAADLLSPAWDECSNSDEQLEIADLLLESNHRAQNPAEVARIKTVLEHRAEGNPAVQGVLGHQRIRDGDLGAGIGMLSSAVENMGESAPVRLRLVLSHHHYQMGSYHECAATLRPLVTEQHSSYVLRCYLASLYYGEEYQEALRVAEGVRKHEGVQPLISDIEASVRAMYGDLNIAEDIWKELAELEPTNIMHRLNIVQLYMRRGDDESARKAVLAVSEESIRDDRQALLGVARLRRLLDLPDALHFAYRARDIAFDEPEVHAFYIRACHTLKREEADKVLLEPEVVGDNCSAYVKRGEAVQVFTIQRESPNRPDRGEIAIDDRRAVELKGKKVGDTVELDQGVFAPREYKITQIQTKYLHAYQESLKLFSDGTYSHPSLRFGNASESSFSDDLIRLLDERYHGMRQVVSMYLKNEVPLGIIAQATNHSVIEVWHLLTSFQDARLHVSTPLSSEGEIRLATLRSSETLVLDLTSVLTIVLLGAEEHVVRRCASLKTAQCVLDCLLEAKRQQALMRPSRTMFSDGQNRYLVDITEDATAQAAAFLDRACRFVQQRVDVLAAEDLAGIGSPLLIAVGQASLAPVLLARRLGVPLMSDDLRLRKLAKGEWGVESCTTYDVLADLLANGDIQEEVLFDATKVLIICNYYFIPVSAAFLLFTFMKGDLAVTAQVQRILRELGGDRCEAMPAIQVAAKAIWDVWGHPGLPLRKEALLGACLRALVAGRSHTLVLRDFELAIRNLAGGQLVIVPGRAVGILAAVKQWARCNPV